MYSFKRSILYRKYACIASKEPDKQGLSVNNSLKKIGQPRGPKSTVTQNPIASVHLDVFDMPFNITPHHSSSHEIHQLDAYYVMATNLSTTMADKYIKIFKSFAIQTQYSRTHQLITLKRM